MRASPSTTSMTTKEVNKSSSLPPYPEMITKATEALSNDNDGASKSAISNYIELTYGKSPACHSTRLSNHLDKMQESGEIMFSKNNYVKPDPNAPPKQGRGRPHKHKDHLASDTILSPPRRKGLPPKDPNTPPKPPSTKVSSGSGRPRGRPKKIARTEATSTLSSTGRPNGRPSKVKP